jgi:hypothetical protein
LCRQKKPKIKKSFAKKTKSITKDNQMIDKKHFKINEKNPQIKNGVAAFLRFIKHIKLPKLFAKLPDKRQKGKIDYSISSLALWAFSTCIFRQNSKNTFHTTLQNLGSDESKGILNLLQIEDKINLPNYTTVDEALKNIHYEELNNIIFHLFEQLKKRKLFYNHLELLSGDYFIIAADGHWTHTYDHPHVCDENGNNTCTYCLPRKRHKGTPKEEIYWIHMLVTFVLIFKDFSIPIYVYPLQSNQVNTSQSDNKLKQECELQAVHRVLQLIKDRFSKTKFLFLGDALYANTPFIKLCNDLNFEYKIVLKDNLKTVRQKCDELANLDFYKKSYAHKQKIKDKNKLILKNAAWFNNIQIEKDLFINVLRFSEEKKDENDQIISSYNGEWLCSKKTTQVNCFKEAQIARLRWLHEDVHNTLKNRGFNIKHDMSRKSPNLLIFWKIMIFIALFVFEIFRYSTIAIKCRKNLSFTQFAINLMHQLLKFSWDKIRDSPFLIKSKVQFRYVFARPQ